MHYCPVYHGSEQSVPLCTTCPCALSALAAPLSGYARAPMALVSLAHCLLRLKGLILWTILALKIAYSSVVRGFCSVDLYYCMNLHLECLLFG